VASEISCRCKNCITKTVKRVRKDEMICLIFSSSDQFISSHLHGRRSPNACSLGRLC
jgi:hypothetical protein